ncbi:MAG: nucleoside deaminase [Tenericutes bacterium]|nr:nucleoside deaminase [Mycoplasmatota bacterium]
MNDKYMEIAINEAKKAKKSGEVPVGAVIVKNDKVIAKAHNLVEKKHNCLLHAELIAIKKASKKLKNWRLLDCTMYVTLEPGKMCKNAISLSRISKVIYSSDSNNKIKIDDNNYFKYGKYKNVTDNIIQIFFKNKRNVSRETLKKIKDKSS